MPGLIVTTALNLERRDIWFQYWDRIIRSRIPDRRTPADKVIKLPTNSNPQIFWLSDSETGAGVESNGLQLGIHFGKWLPEPDQTFIDFDSITTFRLHHDDEVYKRPGVRVLEELRDLAEDDPFKIHVLIISGREENQPPAQIVFYMMQDGKSDFLFPLTSWKFIFGMQSTIIYNWL